jgi:hypothetical protein
VYDLCKLLTLLGGASISDDINLYQRHAEKDIRAKGSVNDNLVSEVETIVTGPVLRYECEVDAKLPETTHICTLPSR